VGREREREREMGERERERGRERGGEREKRKQLRERERERENRREERVQGYLLHEIEKQPWFQTGNNERHSVIEGNSFRESPLGQIQASILGLLQLSVVQNDLQQAGQNGDTHRATHTHTHTHTHGYLCIYNVQHFRMQLFLGVVDHAIDDRS
jgi:hypothetical protein